MKARQIADQYLSKVSDRGYPVSTADVPKRSEPGIMIVMIVEAIRAAAIQYSLAGLMQTIFRCPRSHVSSCVPIGSDRISPAVQAGGLPVFWPETGKGPLQSPA